MEELSCYEKVEKKFSDAFASFGRFVARHPWKILLVTIFINLALGLGITKLELLIDAPTVFLPSGTQAWADEETVRKIFPDLSRSNFNKLQLNSFGKWASVLIRSKVGNILEGNALEEISTLNDVIRNITAESDKDTDIKLSDICARTNGECNVDGALFWTPEFLGAVKQRNIPFPWFMTSKGVSNYKTLIGGRVDRNDTHLHGMEYVKIEYNLRTDGYNDADIRKWNNAFLRTLKNYSSETIELLYAHFGSLDEEFHENVLGDLSLFFVTAGVMVGYSILATVSTRLTDSVGQRMLLGAAGWLATGLAILSSIGLCAAIGVEFVSVVGASPFLVAGIGIDDMFILMSGLSGAQTQPTISDRLAETMRVSGVGITITTLTDMLAFGCGATSSFLGVKNFCIYTGVAVTFCYINNITIFLACVALNERRVMENKHWLTCRPIKTKEEVKLEGHTKTYMMCCTGKPPTSRSEAESFLDKFPRWLLPKIVFCTPLKIGICFVFIGYLAAAIYGCVYMKQGLRFSELPNDASYFKEYAVTEEDFFPRQTPVSFVIRQHYNYSSPDIQNNIESFMAKVRRHKSFEDDFEVNWLNVYKDTPFHNNTDEEAFISGLQSFLSHPFGVHFRNDVVFDKSKTKIISSRMYVRSEDLLGSQEEGDLMLLARDLTKDFECDCFAYFPSFIQFEQYVLILQQTMTTVGNALVVVLLVTFIFMPHPLLILFCTIAVAMTMTGVIGFMLYIDRALSSITMGQIIVGIGFSVDFSAHICHGYMCSTGNTRAARVRGAIDKTGSPITHGAISSLLGVVVLIGASSYVFRTFAAIMAFVLVFGWAHALLLMPVMLSWIGPCCTKSKRLPRSPIQTGSNVGQRLASVNELIPDSLLIVHFSCKEEHTDTFDESTNMFSDDQTCEFHLEQINSNPDACSQKVNGV